MPKGMQGFQKGLSPRITEKTHLFVKGCTPHNKGGTLVAHHRVPYIKILNDFLSLNPSDDLVELAKGYAPFWDIDNGETLCNDCHKETDSYSIGVGK